VSGGDGLSVRVVNEKERERRAPKAPRGWSLGRGISFLGEGEIWGRVGRGIFHFFMEIVHCGAFWAPVLMLV